MFLVTGDRRGWERGYIFGDSKFKVVHFLLSILKKINTSPPPPPSPAIINGHSLKEFSEDLC